MTNRDFLTWLHNRLVVIHREPENVDYMVRLRNLIETMPEAEEPPRILAAKTVHKFVLLFKDDQSVEMPVGAQILCVQNQREWLCIWALVDNQQAEYEIRSFKIYGTGHQINAMNEHNYIGSPQFEGGVVWHLFEINPMPF